MKTKQLKMLIEREVYKALKSANKKRLNKISHVNEAYTGELIDKRSFIKNVVEIIQLVSETSVSNEGEFSFVPADDDYYTGDFEGMYSENFDECNGNYNLASEYAEELYNYYIENGPGTLELTMLFNNEELAPMLNKLAKIYPSINYNIEDSTIAEWDGTPSAEGYMVFDDTQFDVAIKVLKRLIKFIDKLYD